MTPKGLVHASSDKDVVECEVGIVSDLVYFQSVSLSSSEDDGRRWFLNSWKYTGLDNVSVIIIIMIQFLLFLLFP
jgi:hypothetical protein